MKHICLIILIFVFCRPAQAQINLVPNPSFEDTIACPTNVAGQYGDQIYNLTNWFPAGNSPDYFNICSNLNVSIPFNYFGCQFPLSGNGYVGLYTSGNYPTQPNYREYVGVELNQSMVVGTKYYFKMAVCAAHSGSYTFFNSISNNMGIKLSSSHYESLNNPLIPDNLPTLNYDTIISDSINWKIINFSYVADSSYGYMYLGNFYDDTNTDTLICPGETFSYGAYYYIDYICISTDSLTCESVTGISDLNDSYNKFIVYPNPVTRELYFKNITTPIYIQLFDNVGREILNGNLNPHQPFVDLNELVPGVYFIELNYNKKRLIKIIKI